MTSHQGGRWPDFIVIGAMKSGTTSLYRWLEAQPEIWLPAVKEPHYFSVDDRWRLGRAWYQGLFSRAPEATLTGEASVGYTDPLRASVAASRMAGALPNVRLIYLVRHPLERVRSHYRHEVQRNRERRSFPEALRDQDSPYVGYSLYHTCLEPYIRLFERDQICVVPSEELVAGRDGWRRILEHLGLPFRPQPSTMHNVTGDKRQFTPVFRRAWEAGHRRIPSWVPGPVRRAARALLTQDTAGYRSLLGSSVDPIPTLVAERVWEDIHRLETWLVSERPLWERSRAP